MTNQTEEKFWEEFQQLEKITKGYEYRPKLDKWRKSNTINYQFVIKCTQCNKLRMGYKKEQKYCSNKCRWKDPEFRKKISDSMKEVWKDPEFRKKQSNSMKEVWKDPEYRKKMKEVWKDPELRKKWSDNIKEAWKDPELRKKWSNSMKEAWKDPELRKKQSNNIKEAWKDPEYRKKMSDTMKEVWKEVWKDPEYRKKHSDSMKEVYNNPEFRKKISDSMKEVWKDPEFRKKISDSMKRSYKIQPIKPRKILVKIIKNKYPILYKEYNYLQRKRNKTKNEIKLMNEIWDRLYRQNPEIKFQIAMEVEYQKELEQIPLTQCNIDKLNNYLKGERK